MGEESVEWTTGRIILRGEIDMEHSLALRRALADAAASSPPSIVVEVSELDFIDSSGLSELVRPIHDGRRVILEGANPFLRRLLEMTQLDTVFTVESGARDDESAADEESAGPSLGR